MLTPSLSLYLSQHKHTHTHTHTCVCVCVYVPACLCVCIYIYIYIFRDGSCRSKERIRISFKIGRFPKRFFYSTSFCSCIRDIYIYIYIYIYPAFCLRQRTCLAQGFLMGYSMRLELTLVSSIDDPCLVKLVYIEIVIPLSWSVFTLVCFTSL